MKVVVAHNRYRSSQPSGENRVVEAQIELLRNARVEVIPLLEDSYAALAGLHLTTICPAAAVSALVETTK